MSDWKPDLYLTFEKERTQPSIDLVARIDVDHPTRIIDIGCGPGNSTQILHRRWPEADVTGLDRSDAMLAQARERDSSIRWIQADASGDLSGLGTFDIVFSNAAIQWMPDHESLIPNLFRLVRPGGVLAVQAPCIRYMPIHTDLMNLIAKPAWAGRFSDRGTAYSDHEAPFYYDILQELTPAVELWQTDYLHIMKDHKAIIQWYSGSGLRPYLDRLSDEEKETFLQVYEALLKESYPIRRGGKVLYPFTRVFFVARKNQ